MTAPSTFDAGEAVKELGYTFAKYRPDPDAPDITEDERDRRKHLADLAWSGVVPEPNDELIGALFDKALPAVGLERARRIEEFRDVAAAERLAWWHRQDENAGKDALADGWDVQPAASVLDAENDRYAAVLAELRVDGRDRVVSALAEFCQGTPQREVLDALPARVLSSFLGWLTGQFRPEA